MDKKTLNEYLKYTNSLEAYAILFVKKYLKQSEGMWVYIHHLNAPQHYSSSRLEFKIVKCELFPRTLKPQYPPKSKNMTPKEYLMLCRSITWNVANQDIEQQMERGVIGKKYIIIGTLEQSNSSSFFVKHAPSNIKKLSQNLNDRTDPLWDIALDYINPYYSKYKFRLKSIKRI